MILLVYITSGATHRAGQANSMRAVDWRQKVRFATNRQLLKCSWQNLLCIKTHTYSYNIEMLNSK